MYRVTSLLTLFDLANMLLVITIPMPKKVKTTINSKKFLIATLRLSSNDFFWGGESIVVQTSVLMPIFLFFLTTVLGGQKSFRGCPPVESASCE